MVVLDLLLLWWCFWLYLALLRLDKHNFALLLHQSANTIASYRNCKELENN